DNSYHVVAFLAANLISQLNGFTISGGYANGSGSITEGDNVLSQGVGGGFAAVLNGNNTNIALNHLVIKNNYANATGGGVYIYGGGTAQLSFDVSNVLIETNKS